MSFVPYPGKIEIRPTKREGILAYDDSLLEMGEVLAIGEHWDGEKGFLKVGDIVFFTKYSVFETPEINGVVHYVIPYDQESILGKIEHILADDFDVEKEQV